MPGAGGVGIGIGGAGATAGGASATGGVAVTLGGVACLDPPAVIAECLRQGFPVKSFAGKANSFLCPLGCAAGRGYVLMRRGDLDALDLNANLDLVFAATNLVTGATDRTPLKNLLIADQPRCVLPSERNSPSAPYLVRLADRRRLLRAVPANKAYNLRKCTSATEFYSATVYSPGAGTLWSWSQMVGDLWGKMPGLGTYPGLPFTPDGKPEGWEFWTAYALDALGAVLERLSCALKLDPTTDSFSIVRVLDPDPAFDTARVARDGQRIWDADPQYAARGYLVETVRVLFPKQSAKSDSTGASWVYYLDRTDPTAGGPIAGFEPGTVALLNDDLCAVYDASGALTNAAALGTRADERAADYFRRARATIFHRAYNGPKPDAGLLPGAQLSATRWGDFGRGMVCEVIGSPGTYMDEPGTDGGMAGGGGDGGMTTTGNEHEAVFQYAPTWNSFAGDAGPRSDYWNLGRLLQAEKYYESGCWGGGTKTARVTSGTPDANGLYTAILTEWNTATGSWDDAATCLLKPPYSGNQGLVVGWRPALQNGYSYLCRLDAPITSTLNGVTYTGQIVYVVDDVRISPQVVGLPGAADANGIMATTLSVWSPTGGGWVDGGEAVLAVYAKDQAFPNLKRYPAVFDSFLNGTIGGVTYSNKKLFVIDQLLFPTYNGPAALRETVGSHAHDLSSAFAIPWRAPAGEFYDQGSWWNVTNPTRLTCTDSRAAGGSSNGLRYFHISAGVIFTYYGNTVGGLTLYKNGAPLVQGATIETVPNIYIGGGAANETTYETSATVTLGVTDYLEVFVQVTSSSLAISIAEAFLESAWVSIFEVHRFQGTSG